MGKQRTKSSIFISSFGGGNISPAQYITEQICAKIAKKKGFELPPKFWKLPVWEKFFRQQIPAANKLLKQYTYTIILSGLRDKRMWWLESLRAKQLIPILDEYLKIEQLKPKLQEDIIDKPTIISKPLPNKSNIISKLRGL